MKCNYVLKCGKQQMRFPKSSLFYLDNIVLLLFNLQSGVIRLVDAKAELVLLSKWL